MYNVRARYVWVCLFLIAGFLISCSPNSTPPGANSIGGVVDGAAYSYHYWEEGLAILIWHDLSYGGEGCSGTGSTEDPVYRLECDVNSTDGRGFNWKAHTSDGVTADMWIEDQSFDLSKGTMFLVSTEDDGFQVEQLQRDFSELEASVEAISALAAGNPDVADFIAGIGTVGDSLDVDDKGGLTEFTDALRLAGQAVEIAGSVDQPFFSVLGQVIVVNGEDVQVFEYADSAAAETEAAQISPDASAVGTSMMSWVATPHFYTKDRLIILYVGENDSVTSALVEVLGEPIAEGQGAILSPPANSTTEPPTADESIVSTLPEALANQDYAALEELMGEPFLIGYWHSEGLTLTPVEAIEQLQINLLPNPAKATFTVDLAMFPNLGEFDPTLAFGPDVLITDLIYSMGWGMDGEDEAILAIGQSPEGNRYWHGIIFAFGGFAALPVQVPDNSDLSFEAATYRNNSNNFEFNYPGAWDFTEQVFGPRGSGAQFFSEGEPIFSATVFLWDPKNDLDAYIDIRKQGWSSSSMVVAEEELVLVDGRRAFQFEIQGPDGSGVYSLLTEVGENYLELTGPVELAEFGEIAQTLQFLEGSTVEPEAGLAEFVKQLASAVTARDLALMQVLMNEEFGFAFWGSEGYRVSHEQAMVNLQNNHFPAEMTISFVVDSPDLSDVLGPRSILSIWDPARNPVDALFSTGWGLDSQDEAFLIIIQKPDGSYAWDGIILASGSYGGFAGA